MIGFKITHNADTISRRMSNFVNRQMPYATSVAINETLKTLEQYNRALMQRQFDRPTRFTLNAFYVRYANKTTLTGALQRKEMAVGKHYLEVQDKGGLRPMKGFERNFAMRLPYRGIIQAILPADGTPLDAHGNITMAFLNKVMSQLQVASMGQNAKPLRRTKSGRVAKVQRYFVPDPSHPLAQRGGPGVYLDMTPASGKRRGSRVNKMLNFSETRPAYTKRTNFDADMTRAARNLMPKMMRKGLTRALATARL